MSISLLLVGKINKNHQSSAGYRIKGNKRIKQSWFKIYHVNLWQMWIWEYKTIDFIFISIRSSNI